MEKPPDRPRPPLIPLGSPQRQRPPDSPEKRSAADKGKDHENPKESRVAVAPRRDGQPIRGRGDTQARPQQAAAPRPLRPPARPTSSLAPVRSVAGDPGWEAAPAPVAFKLGASAPGAAGRLILPGALRSPRRLDVQLADGRQVTARAVTIDAPAHFALTMRRHSRVSAKKKLGIRGDYTRFTMVTMPLMLRVVYCYYQVPDTYERLAVGTTPYLGLASLEVLPPDDLGLLHASRLVESCSLTITTTWGLRDNRDQTARIGWKLDYKMVMGDSGKAAEWGLDFDVQTKQPPVGMDSASRKHIDVAIGRSA